MQVRYVAVYRIHGANALPDGDPARLLSLSDPDLMATLTAEPEAYFEHIDRASALAAQIFKGLLGSGKEGTVEGRLAAEIESVRSKRAGKMGRGVYVVFEGTAEIPDPEFKARRDTDAFGVSLDDVPKAELRNIFAPAVQRVLTALALALPGDADRRLEQIGVVVYLIDGEKPVYLYNMEMGIARLSVSSPLIADAVADVPALVEGLGRATDLDRCVRLLLSSLEDGKDNLAAFIAAWSALEIFVNVTFKASYEAEWFQLIDLTTSPAAAPIFERLRLVMKDKYRLYDKFLVIAATLSPDTATADADAFKALKQVRDDLFHKFDSMASPLPIDDVQELALKYLRLHLHHNPSALEELRRLREAPMTRDRLREIEARAVRKFREGGIDGDGRPKGA